MMNSCEMMDQINQSNANRSVTKQHNMASNCVTKKKHAVGLINHGAPGDISKWHKVTPQMYVIYVSTLL